ncbi:MAG: hypothetical protein ACLUGF_04830 [Clostridium sp.]|mgnify:FL=1
MIINGVEIFRREDDIRYIISEKRITRDLDFSEAIWVNAFCDISVIYYSIGGERKCLKELVYIESYIRKSEQGHIKVLNIMEKEKEVYSYRDGITLCVIVSHE